LNVGFKELNSIRFIRKKVEIPNILQLYSHSEEGLPFGTAKQTKGTRAYLRAFAPF
jgi:hypothetical protein